MLPDRWKDILGNIKDNFKVEEEGAYRVDEEGGIDVEFIVFNGPLGKMRLEFISKPVVLDKKVSFSNRIGSQSEVKYIYSEDEKSHKLMISKWDEGQDDWVEVDAKNFNLG
ncbi:MAG: hypothetical protein WCW77_04025 [Patescibacteria group bacterium]|jgi:hypothetical protein